MGLIEIPLVDRSFTWSNKRETPTLVRLDRCLVNLDWDSSLPNSCLSSLTRFASDHVPLLLTASSRVPKGQCFRFENAWLQHASFKAMMNEAITTPALGRPGRPFVRRLKTCRSHCRRWARKLSPIDQRETDTKILIDVLDHLEEVRPLSNAEASLRSSAIQGVQNIKNERLAFWRQRFNTRLALEWDENSRFFHASANGRRRKNTIPCLNVDGTQISSHDAKSTALFDFYQSLLGCHHCALNCTTFILRAPLWAVPCLFPSKWSKTLLPCLPWTGMPAQALMDLVPPFIGPSGSTSNPTSLISSLNFTQAL